MKSLLAIFAVALGLLAFAPTSAQAHEGCKTDKCKTEKTVVRSCKSCGHDVVYAYRVVAYHADGYPVYGWVRLPHTCHFHNHDHGHGHDHDHADKHDHDHDHGHKHKHGVGITIKPGHGIKVDLRR